MYEYYLLLLCREEEFTPFEPLVRVHAVRLRALINIYITNAK
jgi:hypothetical protein